MQIRKPVYETLVRQFYEKIEVEDVENHTFSVIVSGIKHTISLETIATAYGMPNGGAKIGSLMEVESEYEELKTRKELTRNEEIEAKDNVSAGTFDFPKRIIHHFHNFYIR